VSFLCQQCVSLKTTAGALSNKCLKVLAKHIPWVDISLIVNDRTLPLLYHALQDSELWEGACLCLTEMVKKGMPDHLKLELLQTTQILDVLAGCVCVGDDIDNDLAEDLAPLVGSVLIVAFDLWKKCEVDLKSGGGEMLPLVDAVATVVQAGMQIAMPLFRNPDSDVTCHLIPSMEAFVVVLKEQRKGPDMPYAFKASDYLEQYLSALFTQMQYPADFVFDLDDEDDSLEIEVSQDKSFLLLSSYFLLYLCISFLLFGKYASLFATTGGFVERHCCAPSFNN
jgi:exportin-T